MAAGSLIRDWIKSEIETAPGFNRVHKTARIIRTTDHLIADFGTGITDDSGLERVRGWTIQLLNRPSEEQVAGGAGQDEYAFRLTCRWSVEDRGGTEADFTDHVEDVANRLTITAAKAWGLQNVRAVLAPQIETLDYRLFGEPAGRLCHYAEVAVTVRIRRNIR